MKPLYKVTHSGRVEVDTTALVQRYLGHETGHARLPAATQVKMKTYYYWGDVVSGWRLYGIWFRQRTFVGISIANF